MSGTGEGPSKAGSHEGDRNTSVGLAVSPSSGKHVQTIRTQSIMRQVGGKGSMRRADEIQKVLSELDRDQDGNIDVAELVDMLEGIIKSRRERRYMWFVIIALFVFAACTIGTIIGLTYAVVDALKDTEVNGSVMYVKGSDTEVVKVGSADFTVVGNAMVARSAAATANATNSSSVMQTAAFPGIRQPLSSRLPIDTLFELKFLHIKGVGEAELGVVVSGVARVPLAGSVHGSVVRMITAAGTITLDGSVLTFSSTIADIFEEAGFRVSGSRRALIGEYYVFGFFNAIKDLEAFGLPAGQAQPQLPDANFRMSMRVYQPCSPPGVPVDLCTYVPPPSGETAARRRGLAAAAAVTDGSAIVTVGGGGDVAARRSSQELEALSPVDLPGTETLDGVRWMAHNETLLSWEGLVRTESYYALYPGYRKVELRGPGSGGGNISAWQEEYDADDPSVVLETMFCRTYGMPEGLQGATMFNSVRNFSYLGVDEQRRARHFQLSVTQSDTAGEVTVDYWDSVADRSPVAFHIHHPVLGDLRMEVAEFAPLSSAAASAQAVSELLQAPPPADCPDRALVPLLSSPFSVRSGSSLDPGVVGLGDSGAARRRATEVAKFRRELAESCDGATKTLYEGPLGPCSFAVEYMAPWHLRGKAECTAAIGPISVTGTVSGNTCTRTVEGCLSLGLAITSNWLVSKMGVGNFYFLKACAMYDSSVVMPFIVRATLQVPLGVFRAETTFTFRISACCVWMENVDLDGFVYFFGWQSLGSVNMLKSTWLKGSLQALADELSPGVDNVNTWLTLADSTFGSWQKERFCSSPLYDLDPAAQAGVRLDLGLPVASHWIRMDPNTASGSDRTALNGVRLGCSDGSDVMVEGGLFGDWSGPRGCAAPGGVFVAARMRMEAPKSGADNTAANAIQFQCNGTDGGDGGAAVSLSEGFAGTWSGWVACPAGAYICGMQVRFLGSQGKGDDTAVSGAKIACCNPR